MRRLGRWIGWFFTVIGALVVLTGLAGGLAAYFWRDDARTLERPHVVTVDWRGGRPELIDRPEVSDLLGDEPLDLVESAEALRRAADDPMVVGLFARVDGAAGGLAGAAELRDAVKAFRARGKPAFAFADSFGVFGGGQSGYFLASSFDEIWLQPLGGVGLERLVIETPFFADALASLGISVEVDRREAYKTAGDSFAQSGLTPENRAMLDAMLRSFETTLIDAVAEDRALPRDAVRALMDQGPIADRDALEAGLIDRIGYLDEAREAIGRRVEVAGDLPTLSLRAYRGRAPAVEGGKTVALVRAAGPIVRGEAGPGGGVAAADDVARGFREALARDDVEAVVLRVDSPGGSAVASETIARAVALARDEEKVVVVSMGGAAASGGYWISAGADRIVAQPATVTGSIGVIAMKPDLSGFWTEWGVNWAVVGAGDPSGMSPHRPTSETARIKRDAFVGRLYDAFLERVAEGRAMDRTEAQAVAQGRVWTGAQALERGLVDALGGLDRALVELRRVAGWNEDQEIALERFPREGDWLDQLVGAFEAPWAALARLQAFERLAVAVEARFGLAIR